MSSFQGSPRLLKGAIVGLDLLTRSPAWSFSGTSRTRLIRSGAQEFYEELR